MLLSFSLCRFCTHETKRFLISEAVKTVLLKVVGTLLVLNFDYLVSSVRVSLFK